MKKQWYEYSQKYLALTIREQYLLMISGLVVIFMVIFTYFVEVNLNAIKQQNKEIVQLLSSNRSTANSITMLQEALKKDPNVAIRQQISQYEQKLVLVDEALLKLTSDLIDPIQMRHALVELLKLEKGVKLISFQVMPVEPLLLNKNLDDGQQAEPINSDAVQDVNAVITAYAEQPVSLGLYRHTIKLKLKGRYFHLRNYLSQLENLSWTFFWQKFQYQLLEHPVSELEIEIYSLSSNKEFIGV